MSIITERPSPIASVEMPGGVWTPKEFVIFDGATTEQLCQSVVRLNKLNLSSKWALGDLGIAIQERKRIEVAAKVAELEAQADAIDTTEPEARERKQQILKDAEHLKASRVNEYAREMAESLGVDEGHWRNCVMLARFFPVSLRSDTLLPEHHLIAMKAARAEIPGGQKKAGSAENKSGVSIARAWLNKAESESLRASELRRQVNVTLATHTPPRGKPEADPYAELTAAAQWAIGYKSQVSQMSKEQAVRVYTLLRSLRELADALRERIES